MVPSYVVGNTSTHITRCAYCFSAKRTTPKGCVQSPLTGNYPFRVSLAAMWALSIPSSRSVDLTAITSRAALPSTRPSLTRRRRVSRSHQVPAQSRQRQAVDRGSTIFSATYVWTRAGPAFPFCPAHPMRGLSRLRTGCRLRVANCPNHLRVWRAAMLPGFFGSSGGGVGHSWYLRFHVSVCCGDALAKVPVRAGRDRDETVLRLSGRDPIPVNEGVEAGPAPTSANAAGCVQPT
jgi:hypothetical protein